MSFSMQLAYQGCCVKYCADLETVLRIAKLN